MKFYIRCRDAFKRRYNRFFGYLARVNYSFFFHRDDYCDRIKRDSKDWKSYLYLKRRYAKQIANLPTYVGTGIINRQIWWCWFQGEENSPALCKACLKTLRKNFPDYIITIITNENVFELVKLPTHIKEKYERGVISRTHMSDIIRTFLLAEYGGVWIDSTIYCTGYRIPLFDYPLFVFQDWKFEMEQGIVASNWLISAEKGNPIIKTMRDLLTIYWKDYNGIFNYYFYHIFFKIATEKYSSLWKEVPFFSNIPPHVMQKELFEEYKEERYRQICMMSDFHKLSYKFEEKFINKPDTIYQYLTSHE